jgi:two-component system phosphate regulon sensor histidine kinase PhoR
MIFSRLGWRLALTIGAAAAVAFLAGRITADSPLFATIAVLAVAAMSALLSWKASRRLGGPLAELRHYVAGWRRGLAGDSPALDADEEILALRDELAQTQQHLRERRTERDEENAALGRDAALLRSVLGTMIEGVVVLDQGARVLYLNIAARRLLDLGTRAASGRLLHELSRSARLHSLVDTVLRTRTEENVEIELSREGRCVIISAGPLELQPTAGVVLVLHDVTELRRLERMRRDFVSNVSHELKTPLTSIQAYADSLLEGAIDDPGINRSFLQRIVEQSDRLKALILDLISLARTESPQEALNVVPVDLQEVLQECLPAHEALANAKQVTLELTLFENDLVVLADREGLRTILDNLIRNAVNYTPSGGRVQIRIGRNEEEGMLEVEDTGIGIPREHQPRVFERFYRVDTARSREVGGTGLGLAIVKHLAERFGGMVELESEQGQGSLFRIRLRLAQSQTGAGEAQPAAFTRS